MKKLLALFTILSFAACDIIDDPVKENPTGNGGGGNGDEVVKKVLLEEFTGVRCNNCPEATKIAQDLHNVYGEQLILMAIHAGDLAKPDSEHPDDFRTDEGKELFSFFQLFGVPVAFIDRMDYDGAGPGHLKLSGQWGSLVADKVLETAKAKITISEESYDTTNKNLDIKVSTEMLEEVDGEDLFLAVYLVENDVVSPQTLKDKSVDDDYVHQHLFRTALNSTYGEEIFTGAAVVGDLNEKDLSLTLDASWVKDNCAIIAFIYQESDFEILQAEEFKL